MKKINRVEKVETKPDVNIFMNKPFISNNKKEHHESNKNFQDELNNSIKEIKEEDESFEETVSKIELSPRDIQLRELRRYKMNMEQVDDAEIDNNTFNK